jgi:CAAX protease family protein
VGATSTPEDVLCAGGTLAIRPLTPMFRLLLVVEMALIYVGAPLAVAMAVHDLKLPVFIALLPVLGIVLICLMADPTFSIRRELTRGFGLMTLLSIFAVFAVGGGAVAYYVAHVHPGWFLEFPRERPETFKKVMLLYPAMSVVVQELVYRTFFFHRYGALFGRAWWLAILLNGALFGLGHVVIGTDLALYGTMPTGALFAYRYAMTRSFWAVFVEHTLWGALVFTVGLGRFFFAGVGILSWR